MPFIDEPSATALTVDDREGILILRWPEESARAEERAGTPMLLLVAPDAPPPSDWDATTDWIRLPADQRDVRARAAALRRKIAPEVLPVIDQYGVLRRGDAWVSLSPIEALLTEALLEAPATVLSRRDLAAAGWPNGAPSERSVDSYIKSLRRRIAPLGLSIHTVRRHGYLLQIEPASPVRSEN